MGIFFGPTIKKLVMSKFGEGVNNMQIIDKQKRIKMIENLKKSFLIAGVFLLTFIIVNIFLSTALFIFKISIQKWYAIASLIITILFSTYLLYKNDLLSKNENGNNFILYIINGIFLPILIIFLAVFFCGKVYSFAVDSNFYHKSTIGILTDGWNPLYENSEDFVSKNKKIEIPTTGADIWINHYARATHVFQANIYSLTNNIECGKAIDIISIVAIFIIIVSLLSLYFKKLLFPIFFGLCSILNGVVINQLLSNYIDLHVYLYLLLLMVSFFMLEYKDDSNISKMGFIVYTISLLMLINIKATAFAYAGIYCLGIYAFYIYKLIKKKIDVKFFKKFTIVSFIATIIGVFVIGLSVYPKNFIDHGNPFYPLYGEGKVDILMLNEPESLIDKAPIKKYFISLFSKLSNITTIDYSETLKFPFTVTKDEFDYITAEDIRLSGNGLFFSGIFLLSLLVIVCTIKEIYKKNKTLFNYTSIILIITILFICFFSENWWARYFPQSQFLVLIAILYGYISDHKICNNLMVAIITLFLLNGFILSSSRFDIQNELNKGANDKFAQIEKNANPEQDKIIIYPIYNFYGALYNIRDRLSNYELEMSMDFDNENIDGNSLILSYLSYKIVNKND